MLRRLNALLKNSCDVVTLRVDSDCLLQAITKSMRKRFNIESFLNYSFYLEFPKVIKTPGRISLLLVIHTSNIYGQQASIKPRL